MYKNCKVEDQIANNFWKWFMMSLNVDFYHILKFVSLSPYMIDAWIFVINLLGMALTSESSCYLIVSSQHGLRTISLKQDSLHYFYKFNLLSSVLSIF